MKNNEEFCSRLVKLYLETKKTFSDPITVEERIFENFPSNQDKKLMIDFHTSPNKNKFNIANQFKDDRYKEIAIRIVYEIARDTLSDKDKRNYEFEIRERFNDDDTVYWNSKNKILASFEKDKKLKEKLDNMNENERNEFKQKIITFLNNESAKWS